MKPAPFDYFRPRSLDEALDLLNQLGSDAALLSGGQSLMPLLNMRLSRPSALIDLNWIDALDYIQTDATTLAFGAMTRQRRAELSPHTKGNCRLLAEALSLIGHVPIRNRGTIGGNIAHADPAGEVPAVLVALEGDIVLASVNGERTVPAVEFFLHALTTIRNENEIVKEVRFPIYGGGGWSFYEISRQKGNYAMAGAGVWLELDAENKIKLVKIGMCSVAPTPLKSLVIEKFLNGQIPSRHLFKEAGQLAASASEPFSDLHADEEYRKALAAVVLERALITAYQRTSLTPLAER
jgi:CO/xanthine dehydrogenase FAD-binding subunit